MKINDALTGIQRLGIDTVAFIYFVESNPLYVDRMRTIFVDVDAGTFETLTSVITLTEVLTKPIKVEDKTLQREYQELFLNTRNITLVPVTASIAERAANMRARYNLRTPDALQIATAIETHCDAFLTNDLGIKRVTELRILVLDELELDSPST